MSILPFSLSIFYPPIYLMISRGQAIVISVVKEGELQEDTSRPIKKSRRTARANSRTTSCVSHAVKAVAVGENDLDKLFENHIQWILEGYDECMDPVIPSKDLVDGLPPTTTPPPPPPLQPQLCRKR